MTKPLPALMLADRNALFRAALRVALEAQQVCRVSIETGCGAVALTAALAEAPAVALVDADLADPTGLDVCRALTAAGQPTRCLLIADEHDPKLLIAALEAGAVGYVTRDDRLSDLVGSIRGALKGEACVPRQMLGGLLQELVSRRRERNSVDARFSRLSAREREVLGHLVSGQDHDAIAARLVIAPQTARTHIQNVLTKLEVHSRLEARALALEHGLVDGEARL